MSHIFRKIAGHPAEKPLLLATIIDTRGSTPQVTGAHALFVPEGLLAGTLGGGTVEADAAKTAADCLRTGETAVKEFDLSADIIEGPQAVCGGWVEVLFQPLRSGERSMFKAAADDLEKGIKGLLITAIRIKEGHREIQRRWVNAPDLSTLSHPGLTKKKAGEYMDRGTPRLLKTSKNLWLSVEPQYPKPKLIIAGAGHVGGAVARLGVLLEFEVIVLDDRPDLAERIGGARIIIGDIARSLEKFPVTEDCYIVIVTRGHKNDAEALKACIKGKAAYIGMIGSARKIQLMREEFLDRKWATLEEFEAVFAPIGLDIGSTTVQEIAVSIAAQLVQIRAETQRHKEEKWFGP